MSNQLWCASSSHPIVRAIAEKYNLSREDAKTIFNEARKDNPALQVDNITLDFVESQDSFKAACDIYINKVTSIEDWIIRNLPGSAEQRVEDMDVIKEILENDGISEDEVNERLQAYDGFNVTKKNNSKLVSDIAHILSNFQDTRRLEFLGNWICREMSSLVTTFQTDAVARDAFDVPEMNRRTDYFTNSDVRLAIKDATINQLLEQADMLKESGDPKNIQLANELETAAEYYDTILSLYGSRLFRNEGVSIENGDMHKTQDENENFEEKSDSFKDENGDDANQEEKPVSTFSASEQNKSVTNKIVPDIKTLLYCIKEKNKAKDRTPDGSKDYKLDPYGYGIPVYINVQKSINKILVLCNKCSTYGEIIETLERNKKSNPWLEDLLTALDTNNNLNVQNEQTTSSKKEQLHSMFFKSFFKPFTRFRNTFVRYLQGGLMSFVNVDANLHSGVTKSMRHIERCFSSHSGAAMFANGELNFNKFREIKNALTTNVYIPLLSVKDTAISIAKEAEKNKVDPNYKDAYDKLEIVKTAIKDILSSFGINVSDSVLDDYASNTSEVERNNSNFFNGRVGADDLLAMQVNKYISLYQLISNLNKTFLDWEAAKKSGIISDDIKKVNPLARKRGNSDWKKIKSIRSNYDTLLGKLYEFSEDTIESMAYINHKSYYGFNNPSTIQVIINKLTNKNRDKAKKYIEEKYAFDDWFIKSRDNDGPHFYSDWLEDLYHGNGVNIMNYSEKPNFCGQDIGGMSTISYYLSILNDYFSPIDGDYEKSWYRLFISSDKPRYSTVMGRRYAKSEKDESNKYTEKDYHSVIARKAIDFFGQELKRCIRVVNYAMANPDGIAIENYDITYNKNMKKLAEPVLEKMRAGKRVLISDVLKNGKYIFRATGASFFINKFINDEIENKTKLGKYVVNKIFNSHLNNTSKDLVDKSIMPIFKDSFHLRMKEIMDGNLKKMEKLGMFQEKFIKNYITNEEDNTVEESVSFEMKYLSGAMEQWLSKDNNFKERKTALTEEAIELAKKRNVDLEINKEYISFFQSLALFNQMFEEFIYNNWLAKANMSEVFNVDLAYYGKTPNFQKRNAQVISSGYPADPDAMIHGERVSDGKFRSITLKTHKESSTHIDNVRVILDRWESQIKDKKQKEIFREGKLDTLKKLGRNDPTDGQGLTGLTALRKRLSSFGEWSRSEHKEDDKTGIVNGEYIYTDEAVYNRLKNHYNGIPKEVMFNDMLHVFAQTKKPFVFSMTKMVRNGVNMTVPVQHKNSEYLISMIGAFAAVDKSDSQLAALARFLEDTADTMPKAGIDTINFDSGVKIGNNSSMIDIHGLTPQETIEKLKDAIYDKDEKGKLSYKQGVVTEYDVEDYKIVQEKNEHFKHNAQPLGSQIKILAISNIPDSAKCTFRGKEITGRELKQKYFKALNDKTIQSEKDFMREMGLYMPHKKKLFKLSEFFKNIMSNDHRFSSEMRRSMSVTNRDGEDQFVLPLDEMGQQQAVEATLYSKIRKVFYRQKTNGGIVVQATSWGSDSGYSEYEKFKEKHNDWNEEKLKSEYKKYLDKYNKTSLHIRFFSSDPNDAKRGGVVASWQEFQTENNIFGESAKESYNEYIDKYQQGYAHFECELPMPDYVKDMLTDKNGVIDKKFYNQDGTWNMNEIKKVVPDSAFDAICYRIPTEAKYSIMACRCIKFSPECSGSTAKYPKELTEFTGSDFDIDTDTVELRPKPDSKSKNVDNDIFDLQLAALRSDNAIQETFKSGDFSDVSEVSYIVSLLGSGYTEKEISKIESLKEACAEIEDLDLMDPMTDIILHGQNFDANDMIGVAAVGVASHAFMSIYNDPEDSNIKNHVRIQFKNTANNNQTFTVINDKNEKHKTQRVFSDSEDGMELDGIYDMDGKLISTEISKYVGASADAAKDAALYRLNITMQTLPILVMMHRLGISSDVARMFIANPVVRSVVEVMKNSDAFSVMNMSDACDVVLNDIVDDDYGDSNEGYENAKTDYKNSIAKHHVLKYSDLVDAIIRPEEQSPQDKMKILHILKTLNDMQKGVRNLDSFTRYNSVTAMKESTFLDRYAKRQSIVNLEKNLIKGNGILLPENVKILNEYPKNAYGRLCSMFPYIARIINGEKEMTEKIILDTMHSYSPAFFEAARRLKIEENAEGLKTLYTAWKNYLLFVGDSRIADFRDKETAMKYTRDFSKIYFNTLNRIKRDSPYVYNNAIKDNSFIKSITTLESKEGYGKFNLLRSSTIGMSDEELSQYKRDWEMLLNYDETRKLATDLAIHFLARAAAFSNDTPVTDFPLAIKEAIPNYINAFAYANKVSMNEKQFDNFLLNMCRNNASNKRLVPHIFNRKGVAPTEFKDNKLIFDNSFFDNSIIKSKWCYVDKDNKLRYSMPVAVLCTNNGDMLLRITDDEVHYQKDGEVETFYLNAKLVDPLGVPNQIVEYVGFEDEMSIFKDFADEQGMLVENSLFDNNTAEEDYELPENDPGRIGTFINVAPFDLSILEDTTNSGFLSRAEDSTNPGEFLESRTFLRRANKIADRLGFTLDATQRSNNSASKDKKYVINVSPTKFNTNTHEDAVKVAVLLNIIGNSNSNPEIITYVDNDYESANSLELSIPFINNNNNLSYIKKYMSTFNVPYNINEDRGEITITVGFKKDSLENDMNRAVKASSVANEILRFLISNRLSKRDSDVEGNYVIRETINNERKKQILNEIINGKEKQDIGEHSENKQSSDENGDKDVNQKWLTNLAKLGLEKINGEKVNKDLSEIFGERHHKMKSTDISYNSRMLSDVVMNSINEHSLAEIIDVIDKKYSASRNGTTMKKVDNLIINAANWIKGSMPNDALIGMIKDLGISAESSDNIIATIESKLEELDIC